MNTWGLERGKAKGKKANGVGGVVDGVDKHRQHGSIRMLPPADLGESDTKLADSWFMNGCEFS